MLCLATVGCGSKSGLEKVIVEGKVTFDGNPVANGEIRFHPMEGTTGPVSGGPIVDGTYRAKAKGGVPVGKHAVTIVGYQVTGGAGDDIIQAAASGGERINYIPPKYNDATELLLEVPGDSSTMTHDFVLEQ